MNPVDRSHVNLAGGGGGVTWKPQIPTARALQSGDTAWEDVGAMALRFSETITNEEC